MHLFVSHHKKSRDKWLLTLAQRLVRSQEQHLCRSLELFLVLPPDGHQVAAASSHDTHAPHQNNRTSKELPLPEVLPFFGKEMLSQRISAIPGFPRICACPRMGTREAGKYSIFTSLQKKRQRRMASWGVLINLQYLPQAWRVRMGYPTSARLSLCQSQTHRVREWLSIVTAHTHPRVFPTLETGAAK